MSNEHQKLEQKIASLTEAIEGSSSYMATIANSLVQLKQDVLEARQRLKDLETESDQKLPVIENLFLYDELEKFASAEGAVERASKHFDHFLKSSYVAEDELSLAMEAYDDCVKSILESIVVYSHNQGKAWDKTEDGKRLTEYSKRYQLLDSTFRSRRELVIPELPNISVNLPWSAVEGAKDGN